MTRSRAMLLIACLAAGCARPPSALPAHQRKEAQMPRQTAEAWWSTFQDPGLTGVIEEALNASPELEIAFARMEEAEALLQLARGERFPALALEPELARQKVSTALQSDPPSTNPSNVHLLPLRVAYEADLFGRLRRAKEAAGHEFEAAQWDVQAARLLLQTAVASSYFEIRFLDRHLQNLNLRVEISRRTLQIHQARLQAGAGSSTEVYRQETEWRQLMAESPALEKARGQALHRLSVLLGKKPGTWALPSPQPASTLPGVPPGLVADLISRRPDLLASRARLSAGSSRVGEARAALFPRISLTGDLGFASAQLKDLVKDGSSAWSLGLKIHIPIFEGGRIRARIRASEAEAWRLEGEYRLTLFRALEEVANALDAFEADSRAGQAFQGAFEAAENTHRIRRMEREAGRISALPLLEAEGTRLALEAQLLQFEKARILDLIQLYKSLGGGWDFARPQP